MKTPDTSIESVMAEMQLQAKQEKEKFAGQVSKHPPLWTSFASAEEIDAQIAAEERRRDERRARSQEAARLPEITPMDILFCLATEPQKRDFIVSDYVPAGAVGLVIGTGATSKSYLILQLGMAVACGRSITLRWY